MSKQKKAVATDLNISEISVEKLHEIAIAGGEVGKLAFGTVMGAVLSHLPDEALEAMNADSGNFIRGDLPQELNGYAFKWIATADREDCGTIVLLPRSPDASNNLREGYTRSLMEKYDLSRDSASTLYTIIRRTKYGHEEDVIAYVLETHENYVNAWEWFPGVGKGVWAWFEKWEMPDTDLTAPRLNSCHLIVTGWKELLASPKRKQIGRRFRRKDPENGNGNGVESESLPEVGETEEAQNG